MRNMIWAVPKLDHFNIVVIATGEKVPGRCLLSLKKVCHLSMSQHLDKKIHKGYSTIQKDPWGFSNLKSTQRAPCL